MKRITQITQAKLLEETTGQFRLVANVLYGAMLSDLKVPGKTIHDIGHGAKQRLRDIRQGYTTKKLRAKGEMLWIDPAKDHDGYYFMYALPWEQWVKKRDEREAITLKHTDGIQLNLLGKVRKYG